MFVKIHINNKTKQELLLTIKDWENKSSTPSWLTVLKVKEGFLFLYTHGRNQIKIF